MTWTWTLWWIAWCRLLLLSRWWWAWLVLLWAAEVDLLCARWCMGAGVQLIHKLHLVNRIQCPWWVTPCRTNSKMTPKPSLNVWLPCPRMAAPAQWWVPSISTPSTRKPWSMVTTVSSSRDGPSSLITEADSLRESLRHRGNSLTRFHLAWSTHCFTLMTWRS